MLLHSKTFDLLQFPWLMDNQAIVIASLFLLQSALSSPVSWYRAKVGAYLYFNPNIDFLNKLTVKSKWD